MNSTTVPEEGDVIAGRYRLERHLGQGGMGTVWLACDAELDDLPVAIKMIRPELAGDVQFIAGLKAEAKSSLALTHPHIIRVFNFHRDETNPDLTFLVLKYIEGETMKQFLARSPQGLAPERVLKWAAQIAAALDYAHGTGVLHRDIKPSNIMIDESGETAYLMDFGISRQAGATMAGFNSGSSIGTPAYMSPQQLHERECPSNDIYSFAATIYEALCGRPPFGGSDLEEQILRVHAKPVPGIEPEINEGLLAGLAKDEEDRPRTATELVHWMQGGAPGSSTDQSAPAPPPSSAPAPSAPAAVASTPRRSGLPLAAIAAGVALVSGFAVGRTTRIATPIHDMLGMRSSPPLQVVVAGPTNPTPPTTGTPGTTPSPPEDKPTPPPPDPPKRDDWTPPDPPAFIKLVRQRKLEEVREALSAATQSGTAEDLFETLDPDTGYGAIHEAASQDNVEMITALVEAGADIEQQGGSPSIYTALHVAVKSKRYAAATKLLELGASAKARAGGDQTPLHLAAERAKNAKDLELIQALLDHGADRTAMNNKGKTAAELLPSSDIKEAAEAILKTP